MKFAHFADCHLGGWRDTAMRKLSMKAFNTAIQTIIDEKVDFVLLCGDLFNTALPSMDALMTVVKGFNTLKKEGIPLYLIAGSHDYAASGKTMLEMLEHLGLFVNVARGEQVDNKLQLTFTTDEKTGTVMTGLPGKQGGLDIEFYKIIDREALFKNNEGEKFSIFLFHAALEELKTPDLQAMTAQPLSLLPQGFRYYAGGHVHKQMVKKVETHGTIVYPGPLFPNTFKELEESTGGFYMYNEGELEFKPFTGMKVKTLVIDCDNKTAEDIKYHMNEVIALQDFTDTVVLVRMEGKITEGGINDIEIPVFIKQLYKQGAYHVLKNTSKLHTPEFEEIKVKGNTIDDIETNVLEEHRDQLAYNGKDHTFVRSVMEKLIMEKEDGETVKDFTERVIKTSEELFD